MSQTRQIHWNLYPKMKGDFRETCKSQNINLISPTRKFNLGIIQIIIKSLSTILVLSSINDYILICTISISDLSTYQESGACVRSEFVFSCMFDLYFFPFHLICNITTFRKKSILIF